MGRFLQNILGLFGFIALISPVPVFVALADLEPPWPPAIPTLSSIILLVFAVLAWEWTRKSRRGLRRGWMVTSLVVMLVSLFGYLALNSYFVEYAPGSDLRAIRGYECTNAAAELYPDCPDLPREALEDAGWESVKLWTRASVTNVRLLLVLGWLAFMAGLIGIIGSVIAGRQVGDLGFIEALTKLGRNDHEPEKPEAGD